jgi:hypothetical protein
MVRFVKAKVPARLPILRTFHYPCSTDLPPEADIRSITPALTVQLLLSLPIATTLPRLVQLDRRHLVAMG